MFDASPILDYTTPKEGGDGKLIGTIAVARGVRKEQGEVVRIGK